MSQRAAPFFCPYCGEQELEPGAEANSWYCGSCNRRFVLRFEGLGQEE